MAQFSPRVGVFPLRFALFDTTATHFGIHCWKAAPPAGLAIPAEPRVTPGGKLPTKTASVGIVMVLMLPLPVRHSPKAIVLLVPSMMPAMVVGAPFTRSAKTPLGGVAWLASYSSVDPTEAK